MSRLIKKIIKEHEDNYSVQDGSITEVSTVVIDGHEVEAWNPITHDTIHGSIDSDPETTSHTPPTYDIDNGTSGGSGGDAVRDYDYDESGYDEKDVPITVKRLRSEVITNYSTEKLQEYQDADGIPYAIMKDGSKVQVQWSDVRSLKTLPSAYSGMSIAQIAAAHNQNFWTNDEGAHVTSDLKNSWVEEYAEPNHGTLAAPTLQNPWHNILLNSMGILLRKGLINLAAMESGSIAFYDGQGNNSSNINAVFGSQGAQIGKDTEKHLVLDSTGFYTYNGDGTLAPIHSSNIEADHARIGVLDTGLATANTLIAGKADISDLDAATAMINKLRAITISAIEADIDNLTADEIEANDISALNAALQHLDAGTITAQELTSLTAFIGYLATSRITTNYLQANYADIQLANVDTEWLNHGMIREASISDAMIQDVSANKLTAGEIDASEIIVSNLMADNILVNTINNTPVSGASVADALMFHDRDINEINDKLNTELAALNARVDSQIETYTLNTVPTLNNEPYKNWLIYLTDSSGLNVNDSDGNPILIEDTRLDHVGDIVYVLNPGNEADGYTYRFAYDATTSSYRWALIKDNQVTAALQRLLDAEGDISGLEDFKTNTSTWIQQTDEGLRVIRSNHTELATNVSSVSDVANGNLKSMVQLWFTKANTTAPAQPSAAVTSTSTDGNRWTTAVPTYNPLYPNYFYCYQSQKGNGDYTWTNVVFDSAMTETQSMSRTVSDGLATYITNNNTAVSNLNDKVDGIQVGGRNLVKTTDMIHRPTSYNAYKYYITEPLQEGKEYTFQFWNVDVSHTGKTANQINLSVYYCGGSGDAFITGFDANLFTNGHADYLVRTKTITSANVTNSTAVNVPDDKKYLLIFNSVPQVEGTMNLTIGKFKLEKGNKATDWTPAPEDVSNEINAFQQSLQNQIDQQVDIWYYNAVPTLSNAPASSWTDATTKDLHLGDLYYHTGKGYAYRFIKDGSTYSWSRIKDDDISAALTAANTAQSTADNKRRIFTSTPTVPYDIGDLWVNGTQVKYANKARTTGSFTSSEWVLTATDDTKANTVSDNLSTYITNNNRALDALEQSLQGQIDQQVDIWYYNAVPTLSNAPASSWTDATTKDLHLGDLYYHTGKGYAYRFIKDGSTYSWSRIKDDDISAALTAANTAQSTADNKRRIFTSTPTVPYDIGDLWVNGTQVKYANKARTTGSFTSSEWVLTATDDTKANSVSDGLATYITNNNTAVSNLNNKIDGIQVGGRNLVKTTDMIHDPTVYNAYKYYITEPLQQDTEYTFQAWDVNVSHTGKTASQLNVAVYYCGGLVRLLSFDANLFTNGHADYLVRTITITSDNVTHTNVVNTPDAQKFLNIYNSTPNANGTRNLTIGKFKLEKGNKATDWSPAPEDVSSEINAFQQSLQNQIDQQVDIWYYNAVPTLSNAPASSWTDATTKDLHLGDLYYYTSMGYAYRFIKNGSTYSWSRLKDEDISTALGAAQDAQTTADNKRRIFTSTPTVPYDIGDLWVNGTQVKYATVKKTESQTYASTDWSLTATDDTMAKNNIKNTITIWYSKANQTAPNAPNPETEAPITSTSTAGNAWSTVIPEYKSVYPYYFYCYQYQKGDNSYFYSPVMYNAAITEAQATARNALSGLESKVDTNTYQELVDDVDEYSRTITTLSTQYEKVQSRGIQLITNGNGYLKSNYNWNGSATGLTFDGTKTNGSPGSFTLLDCLSRTIIADEYIPVDVSKEYLFEFDAMSASGDARIYSMLASYDIDKNLILPLHVFYYTGTLTTLKADLKNGDTTIQLTSATNWRDVSVAHQRSIIFWDYKNSYGYTYPPETFSRHVYADIYQDNSSVDKSTGVITLKTAWTGGTIPKGTKVSQTFGGNTYAYAHSNVTIPSVWTHYKFVYKGLNYDGTGVDVSGKFRQGTALVRPGFLWNYQSTSSNLQSQLWITNISLKENLATTADITTVTTLVNAVKTTADTNSASIRKLETTTDNLTETGVTMQEKVSDIEQTLDGFNSRVSVMYSDLTSAQDRLEQLRSKYAVSTTAAGTAAKVATISSINLTDSSGGDILDSSGSALVTEQQDFILYVGVRISCKFTTANTAANPTLNVNSTGAFPIKSFLGTTLEESEYEWAANSTFEFVYDGSTWKMQDSGAIKRLKAAETNISQNAEAIKLKATSTEVTEWINDIQVGGRNLAKGDEIASTSTEEWTKTCSSGDSSYAEGKTYNITRIEGETKYVLSFEAYASSNITVNCYWYSPNTTTKAKSSTDQESTGSDGGIGVSLTTSWKRYWVKWTQSDTAATLKHLIIGRQLKPSSGSTTVHIRAVKFEVGNKPTSWTPAPEDMQTVAQAQAELEITSDAISSKVSSADYTGTKVASLINQSADSVKIQAKHVEIDGTAIFNNTNFQTSLNGALDDIQVGGRNLLRGTANPVGGENVTIVRATVQSDNSIRLISEDAAAAVANWNVDYLPYPSYEGMTLTFSCDVKFSGVNTSYTKNYCVLSIGVSPAGRTGTFQSGTDAYGSKDHSGNVTSTWQRLSVTKKIPNGLTSGNQTVFTSTGQIRVRVYLASQSIPIDVRNFKLEIGTKATDWTPAPEDVSGDISSVYTNLNNKIDNIQVGSRNLLRGTANPVSEENVALSRATIQTIGADKVICLTPDTSAAAAAWIIDYLPYGDYINKTLILSADIKKADESTTYTSTGFQFYFGVAGTGNNYTPVSATKDCYASASRSTYVTDNWIRGSAIFKIPDDLDGGVTSALVATNFLKVQVRVAAERVPVYVKNLKLEVGNESTTWTQWTPAPEDMASTTTALKRSQRIYYRTNSSTKPSAPSSWVSEASSNVYKAWTTKIPPLAASTAANATKYLYLFTCEQRETVSGAFTTTNVQLDENTTVIDGGTIITNSVTANQLNADNINASHSLTVGAFNSDSTNLLTNWYAVCQTAADTAAKVATITPTTTLFTLTEGTTVKVKFEETNTAAVADLTLKINSSAAKSIKYTSSGGTVANLPAANYLRESRVYDFVYDGSYWVLQYNYNSDTVNRVKYEVNINAVADIAAKKIICGTALGYQPIAASVSFDLSYPLLYAQTAITAGATTGTLNNNYLKVNNISYSGNVTVEGGGANKVIYLKGTVSGTTFTIATGKFLTCTVPTSASTARYIPLGIMSSSSAGYFDPDKEFWGYIDGSFGPASHQQSLASGKTATSYITHVDNNGIKVHAVNNATTNYSLIDGNGMKVYKGGSQIASFGDTILLGSTSGQGAQINSDGLQIFKGGSKVASFGTNAQIGKDSSTRITLDDTAFSMYDRGNNNYVTFEDMRNSSGQATITEKFRGDGSTTTFTLSVSADSTPYTVSVSSTVQTSGITYYTNKFVFSTAPAWSASDNIQVTYTTTSYLAKSFTLGTRAANDPIGIYSTSFGYRNEASGAYSVAEGIDTNARGKYSHAEGSLTSANGDYSHVEGMKCSADGWYAHAEGASSKADGIASHASGASALALGNYAHACGCGIRAYYDYQFCCGKYNSNNTSNLFEIGNGTTESNRVNAFRVTTSNTAYVGSTAVTSDERVKSDIIELDPDISYEFIKQLKPKSYKKFNRPELGFIAQDIEKLAYGDILVDESPNFGYEDFKNLSYEGLIAPLVSTVQTLQKENEQLKQENQELKDRVTELEDRLAKLEALVLGHLSGS